MDTMKAVGNKRATTRGSAQEKGPNLITRVRGWWAARRRAKQAAEVKRIKDEAYARQRAAEKNKGATPTETAERARAAAVNAAKSQIAAKEKQAITKMAEKAATLPFFVEACRKKGLDPKRTFAHYCNKLRKDESVTDEELVLRLKIATRQKAGEKVRFSATLFYGKQIVRRYLS